MHITMVKKKLADGSDCRKCVEATDHLRSRGLWHRVDEIVWAHEDDPASPGMVLSERHGVDRAPFFIVRKPDGTESIYTGVLHLIRERLGASPNAVEDAVAIDVDDIGGI